MEAFKITQYSEVVTNNILPESYTFDVFGVGINLTGSGTYQFVTTAPYAGDKCLKLTNSAITTTDLLASLVGTQGDLEVTQDGRYLIQWWVKNPTYNATPTEFEVRLFKNASLQETREFTTDDIYDIWQGYYLDIILEAGDVINLQMVFKNKPSSVVANEYVYWDGFGMNYAGDRFMDFPTLYSFPVNYKADGSIINNSTDTIAITASTDNLIQIAPDSDQYKNGNLPLLDVNGKVTPIQTGDTLSVDYRITTVAPTTDGAIVYAYFKVSGLVQRSARWILSSTNGAEEVWNLSFSITVTDSAFGDIFDFLGDGGLLYLNPSENINVKNCRVEVARTVRGI